MQIFHHNKLLLSDPNCVIICLFFQLQYIRFRTSIFTAYIQKQKKCFRENSRKISSRLWLSVVNFHRKYNLRSQEANKPGGEPAKGRKSHNSTQGFQ